MAPPNSKPVVTGKEHSSENSMTLLASRSIATNKWTVKQHASVNNSKNSSTGKEESVVKEHDFLGNSKTVVTGKGYSEVTEHDFLGNSKSIVTGKGYSEVTEHDFLGNSTVTFNGNGCSIVKRNDFLGNASTVVTDKKGTTITQCDMFGNSQNIVIDKDGEIINSCNLKSTTYDGEGPRDKQNYSFNMISSSVTGKNITKVNNNTFFGNSSINIFANGESLIVNDNGVQLNGEMIKCDTENGAMVNGRFNSGGGFYVQFQHGGTIKLPGKKIRQSQDKERTQNESRRKHSTKERSESKRCRSRSPIHDESQ